MLEISTKSLKPQQHAGETWEHYSIPAFDEMHWPIFELADGIKSNKYIVDRSSILISKLNPSIKRMWIPACLTDKAVCSTEFIVYKPLEPRHKSFYCAAINAASFTAFLLEHVTGSTGSRQRAQPKATLDYPMPSPCRTAIEAFCDFADPIYRQIELNGIESQRLGSLRDALLPKLMSGEIDVSKVGLMQPNNHLSCCWASPNRMVPSLPTKGLAMETAINLILAQMQPILTCDQFRRLGEVLRFALSPKQESSADLLGLFLTAKEVEGCSSRTITYYESTIQHMARSVGKPYAQIESDDLRGYLAKYAAERQAGKVTIDNIRRILSSFFSWLEDEDYIVKSPVRRIHRVKTANITKNVLDDEQLETLRDKCTTKRDLALIDILASTGMRVGELVKLNIDDIDFHERECIVTGKGGKQRPVYFDARAKLHLLDYLDSRTDDNPALFVSLGGTASRLSIGGVEARVRLLGKACGISRVHPHLFRRTLATHAIDKGMPIEQVQKLLGHARIDTTMHYALVNQNNVKASHRRYLE